MKYLPTIILFSILTTLLFWGWLIQQRIEAPIYVSLLLAIPAVIGAFAGIVVALILKSKRNLGIGIAALYLVTGSAWVAKSYFDNSIVPACQLKVEKAFRQSPDIEALSSWCVDNKVLKKALRTAENKNYRAVFDWILSQGIVHRTPDCARLGMSVANHDIKETRKLLDQGITPDCTSYHPRISPLSKLYSFDGTDDRDNSELLSMLLDRGAEISDDNLLVSIRTKNHALLAETLKFIDPNFGYDEPAKRDLEELIRNPMALAVRTANLEALQMMIEAGADDSRRVALLVKNQNGIDEYSLYQYALKRKNQIDFDVTKYPANERYLARQRTIGEILSILRPTDPIEIEQARLRARLLAEDKAEKEAKRQARIKLKEEEHRGHVIRWWEHFAAQKLLIQKLSEEELEYFYSDKPASLDQIRLKKGYIQNFNQLESEYEIYSEPSVNSQLLYYKRAQSPDIRDANNSVFCSFAIAHKQPNSCFNYYPIRGAGSDNPVSYRSYTDYRFNKTSGDEWYAMRFIPQGIWLDVWVKRPFLKHSVNKLNRAPASLFPRKHLHTKILQVTNETVLIENFDKPEVVVEVDRAKHQLIVNDRRLYWRDGKAFIRVTVANNLSPAYDYCRQTGEPDPLFNAYLELLDAKGKFYIGQAHYDASDGGCD